MKNWTGFSISVVMSACLGLAGCSDDGLTPPAAESGGSSDGTTALPPTASNTNGQTNSPDGTTGQEGDTTGFTSGPGSTSTADEGPGTTIGMTDSSSSDGGSSSSDGGSSSTGPGGNAYEGSYDGTWAGMCPGIGMVNGTFMFDVAMDGSLNGSVAGFDSGPMVGSVDDMGVVTATATGMLAGMCPFDGQIDMMGDVTGMWSCPVFGCSGTWMGTMQP